MKRMQPGLLVGFVGLAALAMLGQWGCNGDGFGSINPFDDRGAGGATPDTPPGTMGRPGIFMPDFSGAVVTAAQPPPPVSGGTLLIRADGRIAIAADPDRDKIFVADLTDEKVLATIALRANAQPGRAVEDAGGAVHVILRGSGSVVSLAADTFAITAERAACPAPRGIAFDPDGNRLFVACAGGELVEMPVDGSVTRTWMLDRDLRDVAIKDAKGLLITRFRSAEMLTVAMDTGAVIERRKAPGSLVSHNPVKLMEPPVNGKVPESSSPAVAWRLRKLDSGAVAVIYQEASNLELGTAEGGYENGTECGGSLINAAVSTTHADGRTTTTGQLAFTVLPVDFAFSSDGKKMAVVSAGIRGPDRPMPAIAVYDTAAAEQVRCMTPGGNMIGRFPPDAGVMFSLDAGMQVTPVSDAGVPPGMGGMTGAAGGAGGMASAGGAMGTGGAAGGSAGGAGGGSGGHHGHHDEHENDAIVQPQGEPVAVAFDGIGRVVVQTREPASLEILSAGGVISLSSESRADTGHAVFHAAVGQGLACASCHPEGGDDGRVWRFTKIGMRRTQNLSGGVLATAPFHWDGDMHDMTQLMNEVFSGRMGGPPLDDAHKGVLAAWMNAIPAPPHLALDAAAVQRGKQLFEDPSVGCTTCHTGAKLTHNMSIDVGTGAAFQTPSLRNVGWRAPYMHDGCAGTLADRFANKTCGGGDKHGATSTLSSSQISDLVTYVDSL